MKSDYRGGHSSGKKLHVQYAAPVWDLHIQEDILKIEMVQRRAARWVLGDSSRIVESGWFRLWVVSAWVVSANFWGGSFRP